MRYRVTHTTAYTYDDDVTDSLGIAHVTPRELAWQRVLASEVTISPTPRDQSTDVDFYGNTVTYFQVLDGHTELRIDAVSEVECGTPTYDDPALDRPWEEARPLVAPQLPGAWRATDMAVESTLAAHTDEAYAYGGLSLTPGRPIGEAATDLMHRIHRDFSYDKTATSVTSTVPEIFEAKGGVCQDFAHLMLACLRSHGLAARYVSGYLATTPPPGKERVVGADASHAWVAVWVPASSSERGDPRWSSSERGDPRWSSSERSERIETPDGEWLALDPTNDQRVDDRYVTVAWGRDYADVPPVKGVIFTEAKTSTLVVSVDVAPLAAG